MPVELPWNNREFNIAVWDDLEQLNPLIYMFVLC